MRNLNIEFNIISVELVVLVIQKFMTFFLEVINNLFEMFGEFVHTF